ncbi:PEGA domain-containing protein [Sorangium sp. So ce260]|uniref:PEGA domain-containing protein n=1 Tax=Sorangium sp. So ce260 TaxID=3133291 RepID=UPI003F5FFA1D
MNITVSRALARSLILVALLLVPSAGRADSTTGHADSTTGQPDSTTSGPESRLQRSADRAVAEGHLAEARDIWLQLWQVDPSERAACNVGQLSLRIGDMPRAAEFLTACLERTPAPAEAGARERDQSRALDLARAKQAVGALTFAVPPGAELSIDDRPVGRTPLGREVFVAPGSHRVRVVLGSAATETTVEARAGEARQVVVDVALAARAGATTATAMPRPQPTAPTAGPAAGLVVLGSVASAGCVTLGAVLLARSGEHERRFNDLLEHNHGGYRIAGLELQHAQRAYVAMERAEERAAVALTAGAILAAGTLVYAFFPRSQGPRLTAAGTRLHLEATW